MGLFVLTFFAFRLIICPYLWYDLLWIAFARSEDPFSIKCIPWHFKYFLLVFGIIFNVLNAFWGVKIIKKVLRKVNGIEKVQANNHIKDR
jgi:TLC domain